MIEARIGVSQAAEMPSMAATPVTTTPNIITVPPVNATIIPSIITADHTKYQGRFLWMQFNKQRVFIS